MVANTPIPEQMSHLPVDPRGYAVPYFAMWFDGKPDFRITDGDHLIECVKGHLCMICAKPFGDEPAVFAMGPLSTITRQNDEPGMHQVCVEYAAQTCPWMLKPGMKRIGTGTHPDAVIDAGIIEHENAVYGGASEVWALWHTSPGSVSISIVPPGMMQVDFHCDPIKIDWWTRGRPATRAEVSEALLKGRDFLLNHKKHQSKEILDYISRMYLRTLPFIPQT